MKKKYLQPSVEMGDMEMESMICSSPGVTSDTGITYGGVDADGSKDPASRQLNAWEEEDVFDEDF